MNPNISVVMPVLNGEKYLRASIESVLNQSLKDFEFIIINDGSTDKTEEIIKSYSDNRIVYINNQGNKGLSKSFNIGISASKGKYIARMDADDICLPNRLEEQFNFLERNKNIGIVGTSAELIDESGKKVKILKKPTGHILIKWSSLFSTPLIHPSVMGREEIFKSNPYDESLTNSEDYELWSRLIFKKGIALANIQTSLIEYRVFPTSFTQKLNTNKRLNSAVNTIKNIEHYIELNQEQKNLIIALRQEKKLRARELLKILHIYWQVANAFSEKESLDSSTKLQIYLKLFDFKIFLFKYWLKQFVR